MIKNIGSTDKIIRIVVALVFGILFITGTVSGLFGIILLILAVTLILTSVINFCPAYLPLGISTCKNETKE